MRQSLIIFSLVFLCCSGKIKAQIISTIAGYGVGDGGIAVMAELYQPISIAIDTAGNVYFADPSQSTIRKISTSGIITTFAGNRVSGFNGDGIPDTFAELNHPTGIKADNKGNLYIADYSNNRIRKINPSGIISTIAGTGIAGFSGDGGPASLGKLVHPSDIALDTFGNIFIADQGNERIRKISRAGIISTIAGNGTIGFSGDGGPASAALINFPVALATDSTGDLFVVDNGNNAIREIKISGYIQTLAGNGSSTGGYSGDGGPATAAVLSNPSGVSVDASGNIYVSDNTNNRIRVINSSGIINPFSGIDTWGFSGDGGPADSARIHNPCGSAIDKAGNFYFADNANERVRKINTSGTISTIAGQNGTAGDGGPATAAGLSIPLRIALDKAGNKYIVDYGNDRIKKIDATGIIKTIAGNGTIAHGGDGGPADSASINLPTAIVIDTNGNIYFTESHGNRVRKINNAGTISTIAGTGGYAFSGDGGPATAAGMNNPSGLAFDSIGNLYVADFNNNRIRKIDTDGLITTIAGSGTAGYLGDGATATAAELNGPIDIAIDITGNLLIADQYNHCIRKINSLGVISTIAGKDTAGFSGDGGPATAAKLNQPYSIITDSMGFIYIADYGNNRVRRIDTAGNITTLGGTGTSGYSGDGGISFHAELYSPTGVTTGGNGILYIADSYNNKIRTIDSCTLPHPLEIETTNRSWTADIFPNPAQNVLHVQVDASLLPGIIQLYDVAGKNVCENELMFLKETIDIQKLPLGLYIVKLTNKYGEQQVFKLVKDK